MRPDTHLFMEGGTGTGTKRRKNSDSPKNEEQFDLLGEERL